MQTPASTDPVSKLVSEVPVTISNSQTLPTPAPFQQLIQVDSSEYSSLEAQDLQNVEFLYANGSLIPSWLESGGSSSTDSVYWLRLSSSIPAESSLTIYMGLASQTTNLFDGITVGENPLLSPSYGEYDNGANVFNFYDNFAGTTLNSTKWDSASSSSNTTLAQVSVRNGLSVTVDGGSLAFNSGPPTCSCPSEWAGIVSKQPISPSDTMFESSVAIGGGLQWSNPQWQAWGQYYPTVSLGETVSPSLNANGYFATGYGWYQDEVCNFGYSVCQFGPYSFGIGTGNLTSGLYLGQATNFNLSPKGEYGFRWRDTAQIEVSFGQYQPGYQDNINCSTICVNTVNGTWYHYINQTSYFGGVNGPSIIPTPSSAYMVLGISQQSYPGLISANWIRDRTAPPNGAMPRASLGLASSLPVSKPDRFWSGYVALGNTTMISGSWTVQTAKSQGYSLQWVGIGGLNDAQNNLIQAGTASNYLDCETEYYAWWEVLPNLANLFVPLFQMPIPASQLPVSPGDAIYTTIYLSDTTNNVWNITIDNLSNGKHFSHLQNYVSSMDSADWIEERPKNGLGALTLADFGTASFGVDSFSSLFPGSTNMATIGVQTDGFSKLNPTRLVIKDSSGIFLAEPSVISPDGASFTVTFTGQQAASICIASSSAWLTSHTIDRVPVSLGSAFSDQSSVTGLSFHLTGSATLDNTTVAFVSGRYNGQPAETSPPNVDRIAFYDAIVWGPVNGSVAITIVNPNATQQMVMQYWNGSSWLSATNTTALAGKITGTIPAAELTGTVIVVGTVIVNVPDGGGGGGGPTPRLT